MSDADRRDLDGRGHRRLVLRGRAVQQHAGAGRLLGDLVRAVQDGRARCSRRSPPRRPAQLTVAKLDVDENPATARDFQVVSIPTMILFKDGQPVKRIVGAKGKAALLRELSDVV